MKDLLRRPLTHVVQLLRTREVSPVELMRTTLERIAETRESLNAFKIPSLWGLERTAPYFHDNSARTLDEVAQHYARFFGPIGLELTEQDQKDMVAYMKLLK